MQTANYQRIFANICFALPTAYAEQGPQVASFDWESILILSVHEVSIMYEK